MNLPLLLKSGMRDYRLQIGELDSSALPAFIAERQIVAVKISNLVGALRSELLLQDGYVDEDEDEQADNNQDDMVIR